jgi:polyphosphate kinase
MTGAAYGGTSLSAKPGIIQFFNRELSWLEFNARVLEEALDPANPLLERLKFLSIVSTNFDEFFMVRVAALKAALRSGDLGSDASGQTPETLLGAIAERSGSIYERQYRCLRTELLPALAAAGITLVESSRWTPQDRRFLEGKFMDSIFPVLTPLAVEEDREFPTTGNLRVHAAFSLSRTRAEGGAGARADETAGDAACFGADDGGPRLAVVQIPPNCDKFIRMPGEGPGLRLALIDDLVERFGGALFPGWTVEETLLFKVIRDADSGVDEERDDDFVAAMEELLAGRQNSWPVHLVVSDHACPLADRIVAALGFGEDDITRVQGPVELRSFMELASSESLGGGPAFAALRYESWPPVPSFEVPEGSSIWEEIAKADRLVHLPWESFDPVIKFLEAAADDPQVLAIRMTLYRTSGNSPIVRALTRAARNGRQVTVVMELKARFDEERNIAWANRLEQAGAIVTCGVARLKVHAKAVLVVRREEGGMIRRYLHLSTGNYNERTARLYTDLSLFTCNEELCRDASGFFNMLTGWSAARDFSRLVAAPFALKTELIALIEREIQRSSPEIPGLIQVKLNALADIDVIKALYRASQAGVRVRLNVRGVCLLKPGLKGLSENIQVVSVVGRFLEHTRIMRFGNGGNEEIYLSSADWMSRNLEKRVELMFPLLDPRIRERVAGILDAYFRDDAKARKLGPDGLWKRVPRGGSAYSAQDDFHEEARRRHELEERNDREELVVRRLPGTEG